MMPVENSMSWKKKEKSASINLVLIINECYSDNIGDQVISSSLKKLIEKEGLLAVSVDFTRKKLSTNRIQDKPQLGSLEKIYNSIVSITLATRLQWLIRNIPRIISVSKIRYRTVVIGGGQLVLSNKIFPVAMLSWVLALKLFGNRINIVGVGCGEKFHLHERLFYKIALSLCDSIYMREKESVEKMRKLFGVKSDFIPDLAYALPINTAIRKKNQCILGIINYNVYVRYAQEVNEVIKSENEFMEDWLRCLIDNSITSDKIILASTTQDDAIQAKKFFNHIMNSKYSFRVEYLDSVLAMEKYIDLLSESRTVISARMHSLILAHKLKCNVISWNVSKKIVNFEKEYLQQPAEYFEKNVSDTFSSVIS
jgi:polysaccharide pyruvyl transferase WcaK-like protein